MLRFEKFGGRFNAARYYGYRALAALGVYGGVRAIDAERIDRLVFICTGNICRSPYGDWKVRGMGVRAVSCGTHAIDGAPANDSAARIARGRGIDLGQHASTRIESLAFQPGDLAIALEPKHLEIAAPLARRAGAQSTLLGMWCSPRLPYIPDPYAMSDACFLEVFGLIDEALDNLLQEIRGSVGDRAAAKSR